MDQCRVGMYWSRVILRDHASVPADHGLIPWHWISHSYMTTEGRSWAVDTRTWTGHESAMDRRVKSGRPLTSHVPGHESSGLVVDQALCQPCQPSLVLGHD